MISILDVVEEEVTLQEEVTVTLEEEEEIDENSTKQTWYLDLGCSNHMTRTKSWFFRIDESFKHTVKLGNNSKLVVSGKGNIRFEIDGITQTTTDVFFVPLLTTNLLSVGKLQEKGVAEVDTTDLWHKRYGHLNNKSIRTMQHKQMVKGLPYVEGQTKGEESATVQVEQDEEEENGVEQRTTGRMGYQPDIENLSDTEGSPQVRNRRQPFWMDDYESGEGLSEDEVGFPMFSSHDDPINFEEAAKEEKWVEAMKCKLESIKKNKTWELVVRSEGVKTIGVKWIFKIKLNENGEVEKYNARLVVKSYAQKKGVDYDAVFAPVARWDTIRTLLVVAAQKGWNVYQLDVKSALIHRIKRSCLRGPASRFCQEGMIEGYFIREGFKKSNYNHTMFTKRDGKGLLIVTRIRDDWSRHEEILSWYRNITEFERIHLCQRKYAKEVLERFGMWNCNPVKNPIVPGTVLTKEGGGKEVDAALYKQLVDSLMYLTVTRPDMMYVVCLISRFMAKPKEEHMQAAKRVLNDYARDIEDRRIISYGSDLLIFLAYALSMPPLNSLLLYMACDDGDGRVRSGDEESQFNSLLEIVQVINLVPCEDRYFWSLEREWDYSVASIRKLIDEKRFQEPIWTDEGQRSIEINRNKTLSKFPSFLPERVSPRVFTNQRSYSRLSRLAPNNKDPELEPEDNSSSMSSFDSEVELEVLIYMWQNEAGANVALSEQGRVGLTSTTDETHKAPATCFHPC
nr:hypothetical protein [Tanacetum cinerariifolium]